MADEDQRARVVLQRQVECFDRFHVEVVGRLVHQHDVGLAEDQLAEQHAALFTPGNHLHRFADFVVGEQHAAEGAAHQLLAALGPLRHPFEQGAVVLEVVGVVLCEVADVGAFGPFYFTGHWRHFTDQGTQ